MQSSSECMSEKKSMCMLDYSYRLGRMPRGDAYHCRNAQVDTCKCVCTRGGLHVCFVTSSEHDTICMSAGMAAHRQMHAYSCW